MLNSAEPAVLAISVLLISFGAFGGSSVVRFAWKPHVPVETATAWLVLFGAYAFIGVVWSDPRTWAMLGAAMGLTFILIFVRDRRAGPREPR